MKATYAEALFNGAVEIVAFGAEHGNMVTRGGTPEEAEKAVPGCLAKLSAIADKGKCKIYAPVPAFNARVIEKAVLSMPWIDGAYYRGQPDDDGRKADGMILREPGDAYAVFSADCATVVIFCKKTGLVAALHCGRDAFVDRKRLRGEVPREHESVIDAGVAALVQAGASTESMSAHIGLSIAAHHFGHSETDAKWGPANTALLDDLQKHWGQGAVYWRENKKGWINIPHILRAQLAAHGIERASFDGIDTFGDEDEHGTPVWFSNRRDSTTRNAVIVIKR